MNLLKPNLNMWEHLALLVFMNALWPVHINLVSAGIAFFVWLVATVWFGARVIWNVLDWYHLGQL